MRELKLIFAGLLLVCSLPSYAGFDEGNAAYGKKDYATALKEWQPLAEKGESRAQHQLGRLFNLGQGVKQDYAIAMMWYRKAAEQGNAGSQRNIGLMYNNGQGVQQDDAVAMMWYRKAAEQGDAAAKKRIGEMEEANSRQEAQENAGKCSLIGDLYKLVADIRNASRDPQTALSIVQGMPRISLEEKKSIINQVYFDPAFEDAGGYALRDQMARICMKKDAPANNFQPLK